MNLFSDIRALVLDEIAAMQAAGALPAGLDLAAVTVEPPRDADGAEPLGDFGVEIFDLGSVEADAFGDLAADGIGPVGKFFVTDHHKWWWEVRMEAI